MTFTEFLQILEADERYDRDAVEERAAVLEYDAYDVCLTRAAAESRAWDECIFTNKLLGFVQK